MSEQQVLIQDLYLYPIKSCAGIRLESFTLDRFGPENDRRWMLVDEQGLQITQRDDARLALIRPSLLEDGLRIECGPSAIDVRRPINGQPKKVMVWADAVQGLDAGDEVARYLGDFLQRTLRLVWMPDDWQRTVAKPFAQHGETVGFADAYPLLLISQASLDDLNARLSAPVPMNRFRPNIVVSGCEAFAEDAWKTLRRKELELHFVSACSRCVMPSIDQTTAIKNNEILRMLASYRRGEDGRTYFGQNVLYQIFSRLSVGETLELIAG